MCGWVVDLPGFCSRKTLIWYISSKSSYECVINKDLELNFLKKRSLLKYLILTLNHRALFIKISIFAAFERLTDLFLFLSDYD